MGNLQRSINDTFTRGIVEANGVYNSHPELNPNIVNDMKHYTDQSLYHGVEILRNLNMINRRGGGEDLSEFVLLAKEYEFYRWRKICF